MSAYCTWGFSRDPGASAIVPFVRSRRMQRRRHDAGRALQTGWPGADRAYDGGKHETGARHDRHTPDDEHPSEIDRMSDEAVQTPRCSVSRSAGAGVTLGLADTPSSSGSMAAAATAVSRTPSRTPDHINHRAGPSTDHTIPVTGCQNQMVTRNRPEESQTYSERSSAPTLAAVRALSPVRAKAEWWRAKRENISVLKMAGAQPSADQGPAGSPYWGYASRKLVIDPRKTTPPAHAMNAPNHPVAVDAGVEVGGEGLTASIL